MNENIQVSLEASFILNATEDEEKLVRCISEFIGTNKLSRVVVKGYYGNLMHIITMAITKNRAEVIIGKLNGAGVDSPEHSGALLEFLDHRNRRLQIVADRRTGLWLEC